MGITTDKLRFPDELPEIKRVKTDPSNLHISRDEFIKKRRTQKELEARLAAEKVKIEKELEAEGTLDLQEVEEESEMQTVETVAKKRGRKAKEV